VLEIDNSFDTDAAYTQHTKVYQWPPSVTTLAQIYFWWMRPYDNQGEVAYISIYDNDPGNSANWVLNRR